MYAIATENEDLFNIPYFTHFRYNYKRFHSLTLKWECKGNY